MCRDWRTGNIGIRCAKPFTMKDSYILLLWKAFVIGPISADQTKQIRIHVRIKQNGNFEKSQKLKGRSEKFKKHVAVLS
jgi:hypothetical protein